MKDATEKVAPFEQMQAVTAKLDELHQEFREFAQVKSDFQIEKFSILAEGQTRSHQYRHGLKQIEVGLYQVKLWLLDAEKHRRKIARWQKRHDADDDLKIWRSETELQRLELSVLGRMREVETYVQITDYLKEHFGPFTKEQYQADGAAYYRERLMKQALVASSPIGAGNAQALDNALAATVMPDSPHQIAPIPEQDIRKLAAAVNEDYTQPSRERPQLAEG